VDFVDQKKKGVAAFHDEVVPGEDTPLLYHHPIRYRSEKIRTHVN
jgi:hypothetical protein